MIQKSDRLAPLGVRENGVLTGFRRFHVIFDEPVEKWFDDPMEEARIAELERRGVDPNLTEMGRIGLRSAATLHRALCNPM